MLDAAVRRDARLVRHLVEASAARLAARVEEGGARRRRADVERDDDRVHGRPHSKMTPMAEEWEILTLRGLTATDERAEEFTGTLVIHKAGQQGAGGERSR